MKVPSWPDDYTGNAPNGPQIGFIIVYEGAKRAPRQPQETRKPASRGPRRPKKGPTQPKRAPRRPKRAPGRPQAGPTGTPEEPLR